MAVKTIEQILKDTKIYQILRPKCVNSLPDLTLQQALDLMHREKAGYLVVTDPHMKVLKKGVSLDESMEKYMLHNPKTLKKTDTVGMAVDLMNQENVRHVPLVDELGQMTGILSIRTVVNFLAELFPTEVFNLPPKADQIHETVEGG